MLLAADVGNTNVVFALFDGRTIKARWRIAAIRDAPATSMRFGCSSSRNQGFDKSDIEQVIIGSVVPRAIHNLTVLSEKYLGATPLVAGQGDADWGFELDIEQPSSLGADRALNTLAAHEKYEGDLIVIDFGTATTFDAVDFTGAYKGGIIAPGINLSLDALVGNTAKLPRTDREAEERQRHRSQYRGPDAPRRVLGLCLAHRRIDCANEKEWGVRPGGRHRRGRHPVRRAHRPVRRSRCGPYPGRAGPAVERAAEKDFTPEDELLFLALGGRARSA